MSFENFPATESLLQPAASQQQNKWHNYFTAGLIVALLATWSYIIWDKSKTKETIQQKDMVITNTYSERDQLRKELDDATSLYDRIKTSSAKMLHSKDSTISRKDREIAAKQDKIEELLSKVGATKQELAQAKGLIASLTAIL